MTFAAESGGGLAGLVLAFAAFMAFLPVIIGDFASRKGLTVIALILCLLAAAGLAAGSTFGIGGIFMIPAAAASWFAALFCGLFAFLDRMAERRQDEASWRLLQNDQRGLAEPRHLRKTKR